MTSDIQDNQVNVEMQGRTWRVMITLPKNLISFLKHSQPWKKFQQDLCDRNFYDFDFQLSVA